MIYSDHGNVEIEGADHTLISDLGSIVHVMLRNGFQIEDVLYAVRFGLMTEEELQNEVRESLKRIISFEIAKRMTEEKSGEKDDSTLFV